MSTAVPEPSTQPGFWEPRSVAIVHDYLNQPGGAERVVLEMAAVWPEAPILTSLYRPRSTHPEFARLDVQSSFLQRLPIDRSFRAVAPLYPLAFRSLGTREEELVISSSSGWAHGVRTAPSSLKIVYCYTPARWLYSSEQYVGAAGRRMALQPMFAALRRWDRKAAQRADGYIAIAENVRRRVYAAYGIEADVVYPPVDTERFHARPRGTRLLVVSRLLSYKRIDLVVAAARLAGVGLDVVGDGPEFDRLRAVAGPTVTFHGRLDDDSVTELLERCLAVCVPGTEDFGILAIEALAAGKPVVAHAAGGSLETLEEGVSACFFSEQTPEALIQAVRRLDQLDTEPEVLAKAARRFSAETFRKRLLESVERAHERRADGLNASPPR